MVKTTNLRVHRKIRAVVCATDADEAIDSCIIGLNNAMDDEMIADGTVTTLVGDHTWLSPSTYFETEQQNAGQKLTSQQGQDDLQEAVQFNHEKTNCFLYEIEDANRIRANPIPTERAEQDLRRQINRKDKTHWIVTFDLRYDFDANPHKPYEILE